MSRQLTKKQRGFVNDVADGMPGVQAALKHYDTKDYSTAGNIASENLDKPKIVEALSGLGFDSNNAKRVVGEILNKGYAEDKDRLKAAEIIFKVHGDNAPDRLLTVNIEVPSEDVIEYATAILGQQKDS